MNLETLIKFAILMQIIYNKPVIHKSGEVKRLTEVRVHENESIDSALKRFKRQCARTGV